MNEKPQAVVEVALRIPGLWSGPKELIERLPAGHRLGPDGLTLPDGTSIGLGALKADDQFAGIFRSSCREPARDEELAVVNDYQVNVCLSGPGGSLDAAHTMMKAAAAIIKAGGAGVFIDNSTLAHGGQDWLRMTDDGSSDAISFAFVAIIQGKTEVWTMGMHVLGLREIVMSRFDLQSGDLDIVDIIRYLARGDKSVEDRHIITDLSGSNFQAFFQDSPQEYVDSPIYNPFGRLKLVSAQDIAERN